MLKRLLQNTAQFMSGHGTAIIVIAAIICGSGAGQFLPQVASTVSTYIDYTILLLVFLLLFEVRFQDFLSSGNRPKFILAALIANFAIIPFLGYGIAYIALPDQPLFVIGLVIYFMSPCTDWFLGFTRLAHGNVALGAALLPINMIVQFLLYPVYLNIFDIGTVESSTSEIFQTLYQWFLVPLVLALVLRFILERICSKEKMQIIQTVVSLIIPMTLAVLVGQIFAAHIGTLLEHAGVFPILLAAIFVFFALSFGVSELFTKVMQLNHQDRALMTMTTAARNAPMMLAVTMAVIPDQPIVYASIIIGMLLEFPHLLALTSILNRNRTPLVAQQA